MFLMVLWSVPLVAISSTEFERREWLQFVYRTYVDRICLWLPWVVVLVAALDISRTDDKFTFRCDNEIVQVTQHRRGEFHFYNFCILKDLQVSQCGTLSSVLIQDTSFDGWKQSKWSSWMWFHSKWQQTESTWLALQWTLEEFEEKLQKSWQWLLCNLAAKSQNGRLGIRVHYWFWRYGIFFLPLDGHFQRIIESIVSEAFKPVDLSFWGGAIIQGWLRRVILGLARESFSMRCCSFFSIAAEQLVNWLPDNQPVVGIHGVTASSSSSTSPLGFVSSGFVWAFFFLRSFLFFPFILALSIGWVSFGLDAVCGWGGVFSSLATVSEVFVN